MQQLCNFILDLFCGILSLLSLIVLSIASLLLIVQFDNTAFVEKILKISVIDKILEFGCHIIDICSESTLMKWLGEPIRSNSECTRLGAIILFMVIILLFLSILAK